MFLLQKQLVAKMLMEIALVLAIVPAMVFAAVVAVNGSQRITVAQQDALPAQPTPQNPAPHPRRRQYQHQKNVKQLKIVSHYAGVSPIAVLPVKMAIAIPPIPPLSLPTDAILGETGVLVCLDKIPVVLVPPRAIPARLAFVPTPQILISTRSPAAAVSRQAAVAAVVQIPPTPHLQPQPQPPLPLPFFACAF